MSTWSCGSGKLGERPPDKDGNPEEAVHRDHTNQKALGYLPRDWMRRKGWEPEGQLAPDTAYVRGLAASRSPVLMPLR